MDNNTALVYSYFDRLDLQWSGTESVSGSFRQAITFENNIRNRVGVYLIADPSNAYNIRFFFTARTTLPGGPTGAVNTGEPIIEEVDANNRRLRLFYIGPGTTIYAEPAAYASPLTTPLKLYVYQVAGTPVKYFGL